MLLQISAVLNVVAEHTEAEAHGLKQGYCTLIFLEVADSEHATELATHYVLDGYSDEIADVLSGCISFNKFDISSHIGLIEIISCQEILHQLTCWQLEVVNVLCSRLTFLPAVLLVNAAFQDPKTNTLSSDNAAQLLDSSKEVLFLLVGIEQEVLNLLDMLNHI